MPKVRRSKGAGASHGNGMHAPLRKVKPEKPFLGTLHNAFFRQLKQPVSAQKRSKEPPNPKHETLKLLSAQGGPLTKTRGCNWVAQTPRKDLKQTTEKPPHAQIACHYPG